MVPFNFFKEIRIKCNECNDVLISSSDKEWVECSCGSTKVMGKSFIRISGKNYTNLSIIDETNVPPHRGWDSKPEENK